MPGKTKGNGPRAAAIPRLFPGMANLWARGIRPQVLAPYLGGNKGREMEEWRKIVYTPLMPEQKLFFVSHLISSPCSQGEPQVRSWGVPHLPSWDYLFLVIGNLWWDLAKVLFSLLPEFLMGLFNPVFHFQCILHQVCFHSWDFCFCWAMHNAFIVSEPLCHCTMSHPSPSTAVLLWQGCTFAARIV